MTARDSKEKPAVEDGRNEKCPAKPAAWRMRLYRSLCLLGACLMSVIGAGLVACGVDRKQWLLIVVGCCFVPLLWYSFYRLEKGKIVLSLVSTGIACCLTLIPLMQDRQCAVQKGGWYGPNGTGSGMFFLCFMFDLFWFLFFAGTLVLGLRIFVRSRQK